MRRTTLRNAICTAATLLVASLTGSTVRAQELHDQNLQKQLEQTVAGFHGDVGIYVRHLGTGRYAQINPDTLFPTASMIKVPILLTTFDAIERGELAYDQMLTYRDSLLYEGDDILGSFKDGEEIELSKVVMLMLTMSDNTASLWLQHLSGTGERINAWLERNGYESTRMNSRTPGRRPNWERYGWGQTTPREMAELLVMIREGRAVSPEASEEMYRTLTRTYWNDESLSQLPPTVQAASKQGAVDQSRSEVVLVNAPHGDYVFCVITKNQEDTSWEPGNEGFVLLRSVSRALWQYFEPESQWRPGRP
ncbi:MAG: serine hydrolase [Rhodothermales bacterium]